MAEQLANESTPTTSATATSAEAPAVAATDSGATAAPPAPEKEREKAKVKIKVKAKAKPAPRAPAKIAEPKRGFLRAAFRSPVDERRRASPVAPHAVVVAPLRKQKEKAPKPRLRILIAGDPKKPMRQISLPRALPVVVSVAAGVLVLVTVLLAAGSWKISGARAVLERRLRAMVRAADSVAVGTAHAGEGDTAEGAAARSPGGPIVSFVVQSSNTGEEMEVRLNRDTGELNADDYRKLRHLMRCLHTGAEAPTDPRLIDLLYRISQRTGQKIMLVSGFRAPMYSKAKLSYHTRGMAADIRIPGMTALMARDLAESMGVKGLGYYPVSGFIHVDVRDQRTRWIDYGENRRDADGAEHTAPGGGGSEESESVEEAPALDLDTSDGR
ncbi:MAG TPA: DUF882 domain-containing protein [Polyangia bacterium]